MAADRGVILKTTLAFLIVAVSVVTAMTTAAQMVRNVPVTLAGYRWAMRTRNVRQSG